MANKYLAWVVDRYKEIEALVISTGAGDAGKFIGTDPNGRIHESLMPIGIGADTKILAASENLAAGDFVNIWNDSGTPKARKADASTTGKEAQGFVLSAVTSGNNATIYFEGTNTQLTGLTGGSNYFLSDSTPGGATATAPSGTGKVVQKLGKALSATEINFEGSDPIELA